MNQLDVISKLADDIPSNNVSHENRQHVDRFWDSNLGQALNDILEGTMLWRVWGYMAMADIRRRYRRTLLGPFWTTLSLAIFIGTMSVLFSYLWKTDIKTFLPFFSSGFICWTFISSIITESCLSFVSLEGLLKQIALPYSTVAWIVIARNLIIFGHHAIVYLLIMLVLDVPINTNCLFIIPSIILLCLSGLWISVLIGLLCARYRDLQQVISSLLQISLFITPIFWPPSQLQGTRIYFLLDGNPLYHYVSVIRMPMLGQSPELLNWLVVIGLTCIGWAFTLFLFSKTRKKLIFWL